MARAAAAHVMGESVKFEGADMSTKLKLMGVDVASFGDAFGTTEGARGVSVSDDLKEVYKRIYVSTHGKTLLGGMLVGDAADYDLLASMVREKSPMPAYPESLLVAAQDPSSRPKVELSDSAMICSCNNVTKGAVCSAIRGGVSELPAMKKCTRAGTG